MLTKKEVAETIILASTGGNPSMNSPIQNRDVYSVMNMVAAEMIASDVIRQIKQGGSFDIDSTWVKDYQGVVLQYDSKREQMFADLPATRISLPQDSDIRFVGWPAQTQSWPSQTESSQGAWSLLEGGSTGDNSYPFYAVGDRLYFTTMPKSMVGKKLYVRMIAGIDGYEENEAIPIPDQFAGMLLERTANFFRIQVNTRGKFINDSNSNVKA